MVTGYWNNADGLLLQYGTQKAYPELGGDYLAYAETRLAEVYVAFASTTWGQTSGVPIQFPGVANTFTAGTTTPFGQSSAGLLSLTLQFPMQVVAPITSATLNQTNLWIDRVETEQLITAVTGSTGTATGLSGVGFVVWNTASSIYSQVTPSAGTQIVGAWTSSAMTVGQKYTFWPLPGNAAATSFPVGSAVVGGNWLGQVPLITNAITSAYLASPANPTGLPTWAYLAAWATAGTTAAYAGTSAAGLAKVRIFYNVWGNISN